MSGEVAGYVNKTELRDIQRYLSDTENLQVRGSNNIPAPKTKTDKLRYTLGSKSFSQGSIKTVKEAHAAPPSLIPSARIERILAAKCTNRLPEMLLKWDSFPDESFIFKKSSWYGSTMYLLDIHEARTCLILYFLMFFSFDL
jgi:hypothetical protein